MRSKLILTACLAAAALACAGTYAAGPVEKDNYERIMAILVTGSAENKKAAKEALRGMGEAGLELLKADADKPDNPRGAVAWAVLREFLGRTDNDTPRDVELRNAETLRDFARKNIEAVAKDWNANFKARADREKLDREKGLVSDYIDILAASDKPKDFELLLKALKHSLIVTDAKLDWGAEFDVWARVWKLLADNVAACETAKDIQSWQEALDEHFRKYSLMKNYSATKAIQAYHTATLQIMQRLDALRKKPEGAGG